MHPLVARTQHSAAIKIITRESGGWCVATHNNNGDSADFTDRAHYRALVLPRPGKTAIYEQIENLTPTELTLYRSRLPWAVIEKLTSARNVDGERRRRRLRRQRRTRSTCVIALMRR